MSCPNKPRQCQPYFSCAARSPAVGDCPLVGCQGRFKTKLLFHSHFVTHTAQLSLLPDYSQVSQGQHPPKHSYSGSLFKKLSVKPLSTFCFCTCIGIKATPIIVINKESTTSAWLLILYLYAIAHLWSRRNWTAASSVIGRLKK